MAGRPTIMCKLVIDRAGVLEEKTLPKAKALFELSAAVNAGATVTITLQK
jgi:hypothetical protein